MSRPRSETLLTADWLADRRLHRLFAAIERDDETCWVVGGAVRNTLIGLPVTDVDVATTALPAVVAERAAAAGLKPVPTGIEHGTITVVVEGHPFEVTTLRQDIETHGRHATVHFGRDWSADAHRRDFTMNALYVSLDGVVHDFVDGVADARAGRVRFIGRAERRIAEDRLRILRFFRFHAAYGRGAPDPEGLHACIAARDGLFGLSAERIGQETLKLVVARRAAETLAIMSDAGLLQRVLGRAADLGGFARLAAFVHADGGLAATAAEAGLFLAALAAWSEGDAVALAERLRLSNALRDRMVVAVKLARRVGAGAAALLHAGGREGARDAVVIAFARGWIGDEPRDRLLDEIATRDVPVLPIGGRDLVALGFAPGRAVGRALAAAEAEWVASGFRAGREQLLAHVKTHMAAILAIG